jgi:hypothetical protein
LGGSVAGDDSEPPRPGMDPKADAALRKMSKCLAGADRFTFDVYEMTDQLINYGQKVQFSSQGTLAVDRPNHIAADFRGDTKNERVVYSGDTLSVYNRYDNTYGTLKVPDNIDEMLDFVAQYFHVSMPVADLLFADPYKILVVNIRSGLYVGLHTVGGVKCHHLAFQQDALDWQIWIQEGDVAVPRKIVITYKSTPGQPQFIALLDNWNLSADLSDRTFAFSPPEGAKEVELKPAVHAGGQPLPGGKTGEKTPVKK